MLEVVGSCCEPTALHIGLYQGFLKEIRKKYASCCIIACVLIWQREKDSNYWQCVKCCIMLSKTAKNTGKTADNIHSYPMLSKP